METLTLLHEDFFTLGGIFALAGFVVEEFYCIKIKKLADITEHWQELQSCLMPFSPPNFPYRGNISLQLITLN